MPYKKIVNMWLRTFLYIFKKWIILNVMVQAYYAFFPCSAFKLSVKIKSITLSVVMLNVVAPK
jgi:hypothetical protein